MFLLPTCIYIHAGIYASNKRDLHKNMDDTFRITFCKTRLAEDVFIAYSTMFTFLFSSNIYSERNILRCLLRIRKKHIAETPIE